MQNSDIIQVLSGNKEFIVGFSTQDIILLSTGLFAAMFLAIVLSKQF